MEKDRFIDDVAEKMRNNMCELFVGSGISIPSGLPSWTEFLQPYLNDLGIKSNYLDDLPLLAQYVLNENMENRNIFSEGVYKTFGKDYGLNEYHHVIANFPVKTIWTTNYDCLLEKTFSDRTIRVISSEDSLIHPYHECDIEIIKLHGCAKTAAKEIVLTKSDYSQFLYNKPKISERLRETFINKNLFFIGYGYQDPNIQIIMDQAYQMMNKTTHVHYLLVLEPNNQDNTDLSQKQLRYKLWMSELKRLGIQSLIVSKEDIIKVLKNIEEKSRKPAVFVTGSHESLDSLAVKYAVGIGQILATEDDVILNNGQSAGIGNIVLSSFMQYIFDHQKDICQRVRIFPNPYAISPEYANDFKLLPSLKQARIPLIMNSTIVVVFPGGKGTQAEIELAQERHKLIFPVIWEARHYDQMKINNLLLDDNGLRLRQAVPDYFKILSEQTIPLWEDISSAIEGLINGKTTN